MHHTSKPDKTPQVLERNSGANMEPSPQWLASISTATQRWGTVLHTHTQQQHL